MCGGVGVEPLLLCLVAALMESPQVMVCDDNGSAGVGHCVEFGCDNVIEYVVGVAALEERPLVVLLLDWVVG